jgi:hypothetical protein
MRRLGTVLSIMSISTARRMIANAGHRCGLKSGSFEATARDMGHLRTWVVGSARPRHLPLQSSRVRREGASDESSPPRPARRGKQLVGSSVKRHKRLKISELLASLVDRRVQPEVHLVKLVMPRVLEAVVAEDAHAGRAHGIRDVGRPKDARISRTLQRQLNGHGLGLHARVPRGRPFSRPA